MIFKHCQYFISSTCNFSSINTCKGNIFRDLPNQLFAILKRLLAFSGKKQYLTFNLPKVYLINKKTLLAVSFLSLLTSAKLVPGHQIIQKPHDPFNGVFTHHQFLWGIPGTTCNFIPYGEIPRAL